MDAYLLGRRDGELPTELLGGPEGNRVRAMAQLDGPEHNVFFAVEGPDQEAIDAHFDAITSGGTQASWKLVIEVLAEDDSLLAKIATGGTHPSHMPPWEMILFLQLEIDEITEAVADAIDAAKDRLGANGVAIGSNGAGGMLIELGSKDPAAVEAAHAALREAIGDGLSAGHAVAGSGIVKA
jgi:hypothetical protein